jgi:uncharacterized protein YkwD
VPSSPPAPSASHPDLTAAGDSIESSTLKEPTFYLELNAVPVPLFLRSLGCVVAAILLFAPAAAAAPSTTHARTAAADCPGSDLVPTAENLGAVRAAIVCLHSAIRAERGMRPLGENSSLLRAAVAHSADMVSQRYFEHTGPSGTTMRDRLFGTYVRRSQAWTLGENIAWATGSEATPANIMASWMASPGHRANILRRAYREVGVGIVVGVPSDATAGATFTADFGSRR